MRSDPVARLLRGVSLAAAVAALGGCGEGGTVVLGPGTGAPTVDSIAVSPTTARLTAVGETQPFTATAFDAAGDTVAVEVTWSSADVGVATLNQSGLATATGPGQTDVTATAGGATGTAVLTVELVVGP